MKVIFIICIGLNSPTHIRLATELILDSFFSIKVSKLYMLI